MTKTFAITDADGVVVAAAFGNEAPDEGYYEVDVEVSEALHLYRTAAGEFLPRPDIGAPTWTGTALSIPACPLGTRIVVEDSSGGETILDMTTDTADWSDDITFADPGTYYVQVTPPAPYEVHFVEITT